MDQRQVAFLCAASGERAGHTGMCAGMDGEQDQTGRIPVEALHHAERRLAQRVAGMVGEPADKRLVESPDVTCMRRLGLDGRRFVEGKEITVEKKDLFGPDAIRFQRPAV